MAEFPLARLAVLCFIPSRQVQPKRRPFGLGVPAKPALAGLLALLLLVATTLSVSHALHQSLHQSGSVNSHFCLVCSFAKGQVSTSDLTLISSLLVLLFLFSIRLASSPSTAALEYSPSQSRAPPGC
jgi:hypothetical protein